MKILQPEGWQTPQRVLVILAHPDDPEFFCGATLARWCDAGHEVHYLLLTRGDKGSDDPAMTPEALIAIRIAEQNAAARVIGATEVSFLSYPDGYLVADLVVRKDIVRHIRKVKPDIVVTSDPLNYYIRGKYINHPDHRAAGLATLEAVFPAAGNRFYYPELLEEGLEPYTPAEVWVSLSHEPDITLDISEHWETKKNALLHHTSQIGDPEKFVQYLLERRVAGSPPEAPRFEEGFKRIFRR